MENLTIIVPWAYALGFIGILLVIAWKGSGRFSALETSMEWVKEILKDLQTKIDNSAKPAFGSSSPVNLNPTGDSWIKESGLKNYIDSNKDYFIKLCEDKKDTNPYEVQKYTFKVFDELNFDPAFEDKLKKFVYEKGTTINVMRRIGGIYLRNLCLEHFKMNREDIDKHDPTAKKNE